MPNAHWISVSRPHFWINIFQSKFRIRREKKQLTKLSMLVVHGWDFCEIAIDIILFAEADARAMVMEEILCVAGSEWSGFNVFFLSQQTNKKYDLIGFCFHFLLFLAWEWRLIFYLDKSYSGLYETIKVKSDVKTNTLNKWRHLRKNKRWRKMLEKKIKSLRPFGVADIYALVTFDSLRFICVYIKKFRRRGGVLVCTFLCII